MLVEIAYILYIAPNKKKLHIVSSQMLVESTCKTYCISVLFGFLDLVIFVLLKKELFAGEVLEEESIKVHCFS